MDHFVVKSRFLPQNHVFKPAFRGKEDEENQLFKVKGMKNSRFI